MNDLPGKVLRIEEYRDLPGKRTLTPQEKGRDFERKLAQNQSLRMHPASGAFEGRKGDLYDDLVEIEAKFVTTRRHTIHLDQVMDTLHQSELLTRKQALYVIHFEQEGGVTIEGLIYRGHPSDR